MQNPLVDLRRKARALPQGSGVYLMKDRLGQVIYVGKAKNLRRRVTTYFQKSRRHVRSQPKIAAMVEMARDLEIVETKGEAEQMRLERLMEHIMGLSSGQRVMLKLSLPSRDNLFTPCIEHPNVLRVVALSGGYSREDSNARLARNNGMTASFSRALTEGLTAQQPEEEFNSMLDTTIESIFQASKT